MNAWLQNVNTWIDYLEGELMMLNSELEAGFTVMTSFPMNTENCTKYSGCPYHDFCIAWPNPLEKVETPPFGFHIEYWDPREIKTSTHMDIPRELIKEVE
jgi:hypothetical protein